MDGILMDEVPMRPFAPSLFPTQRGFAFGPVLYILALAGIAGAVLFSGYSQIVRTNVEITRDNVAKNDLRAAEETLSASAALDPATHTILEPPAILAFADIPADDQGRLPANYANADSAGTPTEVGVFTASAGVRQRDPWGHFYIYCRWTSAAATGSNPSMALISAGSDGVLNSTCGDATAQGDDRLVATSVGQALARANVWQTTTDPATGNTLTAKFGGATHPVEIDASSGDLSVSGALTVTGATTLNGGLSLAGHDLLNAGALSSTTGAFSGNTTIGGTLDVTGATTLGTLSAGAVSGTTGAFSGNATIGGALDVTGAITGAGYSGGPVSGTTGAFSGNATVGGTLDVTGAVTGAGYSGGPVSGTTGAFSGNTTVGGTFGVTGSTTLGSLNAGSTSLSGDLAMNNHDIGGVGTLTVDTINAGSLSINGTPLSVDLSAATGTLGINHGGTGATTAAGARANLGTNDAGNLTTGTLNTTLLPNSGVTAGTYNWGTVSAKGLVTAANDAGAPTATAATCTATTTCTSGNAGQFRWCGSPTNTMQYCDGSNWQSIPYTQPATQPPSVPSNVGYFVMSYNTWNGNLGGYPGANAKCLSDLTTYDWMGKSAAQANGQLIASKVQAFLCGQGSCNNLLPNATYYFAVAGVPATGGASFTANASGQGPNDSQSWASANRFGGNYTYWTGRGQGTTTAWSVNAAYGSGGNVCGSTFSNGTSSSWGTVGYAANTDQRRWIGVSGYSNLLCSDTYNLICAVNP